MSYLGVPPFGQTVRTITESLATAGQTTFSPSGGYLPGYIDVFLNGSALGAADFTATNGSTVVLNVAAALNDEFKAIAYWPVSLIDTYRKAEADALLAARVGTTSSVSMRNRIINGDMTIAQRGTSFVAATNGTFGVDRFRIEADSDAVLTISQQSDTPANSGFQYSLRYAVTTADTSIASGQLVGASHRIEGYNVRDLVGCTFTLSFWVRSSKTGVHCVSFRNSGNDRTYVAEYTVAAANTWEQKFVTVVGGLITAGTWNFTNGLGLAVDWALATGSSLQTSAGAWQTGNFRATSNQVNCLDTVGNIFAITGVQLEAGTVATPFERRDYGRELMMCQRYCQVLRRTQTGNISDLIGVGVWSGNTDADVVYPCVVTMRATPSVTFSGTTGFEFLRSAVAWQPVTSWISPEPTASAVRIIGTVATGDTRGFVAELRNLGTNTITISAEL